MFGKNEIVGAKYFNKAPTESLLVTSMFFTLQGEGPYRGKPALFIRLAKCNLACTFCDTYFDSGDWMTFQEMEVKIQSVVDGYFKGNPPQWAKVLYKDIKQGEELIGKELIQKRKMVLVITGGEPSLQANLQPFLDKLGVEFENTQIESNGILTLDLPSTTVVVSPKCVEKNGVAVKYLTPSESMLKQAHCLKFVMSADRDSPYSDIPQWAHDWAAETGKEVFISPMNIYNREPQKAKAQRLTNETSLDQRSTVEEVISFWEPGLLDMKANQANHEYAAKFCITHGYTFNMQLHLFASLA